MNTTQFTKEGLNFIHRGMREAQDRYDRRMNKPLQTMPSSGMARRAQKVLLREQHMVRVLAAGYMEVV